MRFLVSLPEMPLSRLSSPLPRWAIKRCPQGGWHRWRSARPTLWARHREDEVRNGNLSGLHTLSLSPHLPKALLRDSTDSGSILDLQFSLPWHTHARTCTHTMHRPTQQREPQIIVFSTSFQTTPSTATHMVTESQKDSVWQLEQEHSYGFKKMQ